jgi:hypothetical protein
VKVKGVSLVSVMVTTAASTTTTELSAQIVQAMPDICHLMVEVLDCRIKLTK